MRRRFTVAVISVLALAPWFWFKPEAPLSNQAAALLSVTDIPRDEDWIGGLSGIDLTPDGTEFVFVTDRGHVARGHLRRADGQLTGVEINTKRQLVDPRGRLWKTLQTDAEGVALAASGSVFVSFEHAHRVHAYPTLDTPDEKPSYTRAWGALTPNRGLEALAIQEDGSLFAIPEQVNPGASEALVYRRKPGEAWKQAFTLPARHKFSPVGADFGPDGRLYVLERGLYPFGFYSRVRTMTVHEDGVTDIETVLHTKLGTHGNLEGLAVWRDAAGMIRLTMVSDDNFYPFMRGEIVEYGLRQRVASPSQ